MGRHARSLVVLLLAIGGCQFPWYAVHNITFESCRCVDEYKEDRNIEKMAATAWVEAGHAPVGHWNPTEDLHAGFVAGFTYWVKRGGDGEPPPVPPTCYWKEAYRSPEGQARVQAWFDGYRLGTRIAREGRYRERQMLMLSRPLTENPRPDPPAPGNRQLDPWTEPKSPPEQLPPPTAIPNQGHSSGTR